MKPGMPKGYVSSRTIFITKTCDVCGKSFTKRVCEEDASCSKECGSVLIGRKQRGSTKDSKKKDKERQTIKNRLEITNLHRETIFTGGHDSGEGFAVLCNEGEIL